jgi:hypothetical protein
VKGGAGRAGAGDPGDAGGRPGARPCPTSSCWRLARHPPLLVPARWCPRGENYSADEVGFLVDPDASRWGSRQLVTTPGLTGLSCRVLLGEPGMGKPRAITLLRSQPPAAATVFVDLAGVVSPDVLHGQLFSPARWAVWREGGISTLFSAPSTRVWCHSTAASQSSARGSANCRPPTGSAVGAARTRAAFASSRASTSAGGAEPHQAGLRRRRRQEQPRPILASRPRVI